MRIFDDFLCVKDQEKFSHVLVVSEINNCDNILPCKCHIVHRCLSVKSTWVFGVLVAEQQRLATTCPHTSSSLKNCNEMKYKNLSYRKTFLLKHLWSSIAVDILVGVLLSIEWIEDPPNQWHWLVEKEIAHALTILKRKRQQRENKKDNRGEIKKRQKTTEGKKDNGENKKPHCNSSVLEEQSANGNFCN